MKPDAALRGTFRRSAIVHDWLTIPGGSEKVLFELLDLLPEVPALRRRYPVYDVGTVATGIVGLAVPRQVRGR